MLELADDAFPVRAFERSCLERIEPFTLVVWQQAELFECRWDGGAKSVRQFPSHQPRIWSSVTLYDEKVRAMREAWFSAWLSQHASPAMEEILDFHHFGGTGDRDHDLRMNRHNQVSTVSITCAQWTKFAVAMHYLDMVRGQSRETFLQINQPIAAR